MDERQIRIMLRKARTNHANVNPDHRVNIGENFVECETCGKHAHVNDSTGGLTEHTKDYSVYKNISVEQF